MHASEDEVAGNYLHLRHCGTGICRRSDARLALMVLGDPQSFRTEFQAVVTRFAPLAQELPLRGRTGSSALKTSPPARRGVGVGYCHSP